MTLTEALKQISEIDRRIDANRAAANDKALERALFVERGNAQVIRDEARAAIRAASARANRIRPLKPCPTCGHRTLAA